jgi:hypothetical protein
MDSVECGTDQKRGKTLAGELLGTDDAHQKMHTLLCPGVLAAKRSHSLWIRPKDDKHPVLLPVDEKAQFRMEKDHLKVARRGSGQQRTRLHRGIDDAAE